jgi:hypothetical protein
MTGFIQMVTFPTARSLALTGQCRQIEPMIAGFVGRRCDTGANVLLRPARIAPQDGDITADIAVSQIHYSQRQHLALRRPPSRCPFGSLLVSWV